MKSIAIAAGLLLGCKTTPPSPLGFVDDKLSGWASECTTGLVQLPFVKGPDPLAGIRLRELPFQRATQQHKCGPPGWSLYVDATRRVVGVCVDDRTATVERPRAKHIDLAAELFFNRFGSKFAQEVTRDECTREPVRVPHGLLRWSQDVPRVRGPDGTPQYSPPVGTLAACCWEVIED